MTKTEHQLLIEIALAVMEMASPDRQKRIERAMEADYYATLEAETGLLSAADLHMENHQ